MCWSDRPHPVIKNVECTLHQINHSRRLEYCDCMDMLREALHSQFQPLHNVTKQCMSTPVQTCQQYLDIVTAPTDPKTVGANHASSSSRWSRKCIACHLALHASSIMLVHDVAAPRLCDKWCPKSLQRMAQRQRFLLWRLVQNCLLHALVSPPRGPRPPFSFALEDWGRGWGPHLGCLRHNLTVSHQLASPSFSQKEVRMGDIQLV